MIRGGGGKGHMGSLPDLRGGMRASPPPVLLPACMRKDTGLPPSQNASLGMVTALPGRWRVVSSRSAMERNGVQQCCEVVVYCNFRG